MSRPSKFTPKIADDICEQLSNGMSLRTICAADGMPRASTVFRWLASDGVFREQYARAREAQADYLADEILQIADDGANDTYVDENGNVRTDYDVIARSKLRVDARKWIAAKLKPKVYGEKVETEITGPDGGPLQILGGQLPASTAAALAERLKRVSVVKG